MVALKSPFDSSSRGSTDSSALTGQAVWVRIKSFHIFFGDVLELLSEFGGLEIAFEKFFLGSSSVEPGSYLGDFCSNGVRVYLNPVEQAGANVDLQSSDSLLCGAISQAIRATFL